MKRTKFPYRKDKPYLPTKYRMIPREPKQGIPDGRAVHYAYYLTPQQRKKKINQVIPYSTELDPLKHFPDKPKKWENSDEEIDSYLPYDYKKWKYGPYDDIDKLDNKVNKCEMRDTAWRKSHGQYKTKDYDPKKQHEIDHILSLRTNSIYPLPFNEQQKYIIDEYENCCHRFEGYRYFMKFYPDDPFVDDLMKSMGKLNSIYSDIQNRLFQPDHINKYIQYYKEFNQATDGIDNFVENNRYIIHGEYVNNDDAFRPDYNWTKEPTVPPPPMPEVPKLPEGPKVQRVILLEEPEVPSVPKFIQLESGKWVLDTSPIAKQTKHFSFGTGKVFDSTKDPNTKYFTFNSDKVFESTKDPNSFHFGTGKKFEITVDPESPFTLPYKLPSIPSPPPPTPRRQPRPPKK